MVVGNDFQPMVFDRSGGALMWRFWLSLGRLLAIYRAHNLRSIRHQKRKAISR